MGTGVRAVYERMRADGRMCTHCLRMLDSSPFRRGPQTCDECLNAKSVLMQFSYVDSGWVVDFTDPQTKKPIGRQLRLDKAETIRTLVNRSRTHLGAAPAVIVEKSLHDGRGELLLELTAEQFLRLRN